MIGRINAFSPVIQTSFVRKLFSHSSNDRSFKDFFSDRSYITNMFVHIEFIGGCYHGILFMFRVTNIFVDFPNRCCQFNTFSINSMIDQTLTEQNHNRQNWSLTYLLGLHIIWVQSANCFPFSRDSREISPRVSMITQKTLSTLGKLPNITTRNASVNLCLADTHRLSIH